MIELEESKSVHQAHILLLSGRGSFHERLSATMVITDSINLN